MSKFLVSEHKVLQGEAWNIQILTIYEAECEEKGGPVRERAPSSETRLRSPVRESRGSQKMMLQQAAVHHMEGKQQKTWA